MRMKPNILPEKRRFQSGHERCLNIESRTKGSKKL